MEPTEAELKADKAYFKFLANPTNKTQKPHLDNIKFRWETLEEFQRRKAKDTKCGAGYYGLADWVPHPWDDQRSLHAWFYWFDVRRVVTVIVAAVMILVHVMLMA